MSNLRDIAQVLVDEVDRWYVTTLSDGEGIAVYVDEDAKILFRDREHFGAFYENLMQLKLAIQKPVNVPSVRGAQIENGFGALYDEILDNPNEWCMREGLPYNVARSLKRQLKQSSDRVSVSMRDTPDGITLFARYSTPEGNSESAL